MLTSLEESLAPNPKEARMTHARSFPVPVVWAWSEPELSILTQPWDLRLSSPSPSNKNNYA